MTRIVTKENSFKQFLLDQFGENALEMYWSEKNTVDPTTLTKCSGKKVYMICQTNRNHHYLIRCSDFVYGTRCGMCTGKQVPTGESFGDLYPQYLSLWSDKNTKTPFEYTKSSHSDIWWKCENGKHEDYLRSINSSTKYDCRCPECMNEQESSMLQSGINEYLRELGYTVLHERECNLYPKNPKTKNNLPYDNEVVELKLIIEAMGKQHYYASNGFNVLHAKNKGITVEEEFEYSKWKDEFKKEYALSHGYDYLAIPYTTFTGEKYKTLIDNKITEILGSSAPPIKMKPKYRSA